MYNLYKKVPKTKEYMYGSQLIKDTENPFLDGPCLLCISAQYDNSFDTKSNFGVTKEGMQMARLRVRGHKNAGFSLRDFPVKFLSMEIHTNSGKKATEEERIDAFVAQYLVPLVSDNGRKIDCVKAMKNMRNVNIMSYCDGTMFVQEVEEKMLNKMQELGYTDAECGQIQAQMCMFPIATFRLSGNQKSTCISFKDINDTEVNDNVTLEERQKILESPIGGSIFEYSDNEMAYLFNGDGEHSLKKYAQSEDTLSVCLSSAVSKALENSLLNSSGEEFVPITARSAYRRFWIHYAKSC